MRSNWKRLRIIEQENPDMSTVGAETGHWIPGEVNSATVIIRLDQIEVLIQSPKFA